MRTVGSATTGLRDLTTSGGVVCHTKTPDAGDPLKVSTRIQLGDGANDLDGTGGDFLVTVTVGGRAVSFNGGKTHTLGTDAEGVIILDPFPVVAAEEVIIKVESPNAADTNVRIIVQLYDETAAQVTTGSLGRALGIDGSGHVYADALRISSSQSTADNLETAFSSTAVATVDINKIGGNTGPATNLATLANNYVDNGSYLAANVTLWNGTSVSYGSSGYPQVDIAAMNDSTSYVSTMDSFFADYMSNGYVTANVAYINGSSSYVSYLDTICSDYSSGYLNANVYAINSNTSNISSFDTACGDYSTYGFNANVNYIESSDATDQIGDAVWDEEVTTGHTTADSAGKKINDASAAGDPWGTSVPGAYGSGTAGYILGTNLDVSSSTLATSAALSTAQSDLDIITGADGVVLLSATQASIDAIELDTGTTLNALILDIPTVAEFNARTLLAASYFDPATDTVANVTLTATTTTNTDMRGTDSANTTVPDAAGTASTLIAALNDVAATDIVSAGAITTLAGSVANVDLVDVTTNNTDMRGTDSANTTTPPTAVAIRTEIDSNSTQLAAIVADTNILQVEWANGGRLDLILDTAAAGGGGDATEAKQDTLIAALDVVDGIVDSILVDTGTTLPATLVTIDGKVDTVDSVADLILVDTNAILVDTGTTLPATLVTIDGIVDSILVDTTAIVADTNELQSDDVPALIAALSDPTSAAIATAVLTTAITESYAGLAAEPTLAEILYEIRSNLLERGISGTTVTTKKLDGSTTATTSTLDDATTPTSTTRAS